MSVMQSDLQQKETRLLETLLSALDARESARAAQSTLLLYLTELLVQRAREELDDLRGRIADSGPGVG